MWWSAVSGLEGPELTQLLQYFGRNKAPPVLTAADYLQHFGIVVPARN